MGDLVVGQPALSIRTSTSLALDLVSILSLLFRAGYNPEIDPWVQQARWQLPESVKSDLDLLHGFSGRMLFYPEEPAMQFGPLSAAHESASFAEFLDHLERLPASNYLGMLEHALQRFYATLERRWPGVTDDGSWARVLAPALTSARIDDVLTLVRSPSALKSRTINMFEGVWNHVYREERALQSTLLEEAAEIGAHVFDQGFSQAYVTLTGQRVPSVLDQPPSSITQIVFCPSAHLGNFVSYIAYEPDLIVYFSAPNLLARSKNGFANARAMQADTNFPELEHADLLETARALGDPTRLRIVDLLLDGELYAQEIVSRLGVAQSAASRHLSQLERAGIVSVNARRGSKYYAVNAERLDALSAALSSRSIRARSGLSIASRSS
jgi:DNA-binding transcriptional ArsR family regulator